MFYKVSVIIPVYNGEMYIEECINSLITQTIGFSNIEIILVDDNSTDSSSDIMKFLSEKYINIKSVFLDTNSGTASEPRNEGIKHASSDYIMFLDMDDYYYKDMCKIMYDTIISESVDVVSCRYTIGDKDNFYKVKNHFFDDKSYFIKVNSIEELPEIMSLGFSTMIWTKIFKKSVIIENDICFPKGYLYEDVYFSSKFYLYAKGIVLLNNFYGYGYHVRTNGFNISFSQEFSENMFNRQFNGFKKIMSLLNDTNYNMIKSELIIDMTKIFLYTTGLTDKKQSDFLNYMKPFYKNYNIFMRISSANFILNIVINFFIKIFSYNNFIPKLLFKIKIKL